MPSTLQVDKIIDAGATSNKELAEYSSGNWSWGSGVPAGTVLQVKAEQSREQNTLTQSFVNYVEVNVTLKSSSSDIYIFHGHGVNLQGNNEGYGIKVYRNNSATVTTSHTLVYSPSVTDATGPLTGYAGAGNHFERYSYHFKDILSGFSAGNTLYYGFFFRRRDTNATVVPPAGS